MKPMKQAANQSKAYTSFILLRDKALERIYTNAQRKIDDELRAVFSRVIEMISYRYGAIPKDSVKTNRAKYSLQQIHQAIDTEFYKSAQHIESIYKAMIRRSFLLSSVGEAEAITRATDKQTAVHVNDHELRHMSEKTSQGHEIFDIIVHSFTVVSRNLMNSIEYSRIRGEGRDDLIPRLLKALPKAKKVKRSKRALKPVVREAAIRSRGTSLEVKAFIPEDEWRRIIDDYMNEYVPSNRGPEDTIDIEYDVPAVSSGDAAATIIEQRYNWGLEREMSNGFVRSVRLGQSEAANQNGIVDFAVIAIIDKDTCEECCGDYGCVDFDGLTTTEVEKLTNGEQSAPPFHFNCRCTMAPMLDNMPELEQSNEEEFNQWLNS